MKIFKRTAAAFLALLLVISSFMSITVNAATPGTTTTIDATYRCYKGSNTGTAGTAPIGDSHYYWHYNADGSALNCPIRFMKESGTGRPIYCIEVGATFGGGYSYSTKELEDSPYWLNLSSTARTGITYTTMYGYPVNNYGAANCDAYAATQTIIWEFAKGYRNLSGRTNAYYYNLMISGSPAESAYNQLSEAVSKHGTVPSFAYKSTSTADSNSVELKYNSSSKQWEKTFTDSNNVLSGYNASGSGLSLTKSGNTLKVVSTQKISGTKRVTLERPVPQTGQALLALYSTSSQNAIIGQLQDSMTSYLTLTTENVGGTVSVKKANESGTVLSGVVFGIYSDSGCSKKIASITTNSSGTATSGEIDTTLYPKVYVREDSMTSDQSAVYNLNSTVYTVTLVPAENVWANSGSAVTNYWKDGYIKVLKKDEAGKVLSGVVFGVYSDSGCSSLITKITTGSDGYGTSGAIDTGTSGSRTVYVKEYSMTSDQSAVYNLNTTVYPVTISAGKTVNVNNGSAVINYWKDGYIKVVKQNENGAGLSGVVFGVYSDSACSTLVTKITTGSDGSGTSAAIDTGTTGTRALYVKEISMTAEQNKVYKMNTTVYPVTISAGKTVNVNNGAAVVNEWLPAKISVTKEVSSGAKLSGAVFTAYTDKDCKTVLTDKAGKNVVLTTDKNGYAISTEIYVGKTGTRTVYLKETSLDNPNADIIALNQTVFPVVLQPNVTTAVNDGKAVVNEYKPGKIMIVKENQNGNRLAGITFSVYTDKSCRTLLTTIVTDQHGVGISEEIPIDGTGERRLYVKETALAQGTENLYELSSTVYPVTIYPNQTIQANNGRTIINRWTFGQISLEKQYENGKPIAGVVFSIWEDADCVTPLLGANGKQVFMTTGEDGKALSEGIEVGNGGTRKLYVKEHSVPKELEGKIKMSGTVYPVAISAGKVSPLNNGEPIINEWQPAKFTLSKVNPADEAIKGAEFTAYCDAECKYILTDYMGENVVIVTDKDGKAESQPIRVGNDGALKIYVKETAVVDDTVVLNDTVFEVTLEAGSKAAVNDGKAIVDEWKPAKIELTKVNKAEKALEGVTFGVYSDKECKTAVTDVDGKEVILTTGKDGHAVSNFISIGKAKTRTVYVKELALTEEQQAVYDMNATVFEVTLTPAQTVKVNNGKVVNEWKPASLSLVKQYENKKPMSGVVFGIWEDEKCGKPLLGANGKQITMTTGADGKASAAGIAVGNDGTRKLFVREISVPAEMKDSIVMSDKVYPVTVAAGKDTPVNSGQPVINEWKTSRFILGKVNPVGDPVVGAEFTAYTDADCKNILKGADGKDVIVTTDENGVAESADIKVNEDGFLDVYIKETAVADKTVALNDTVFEITIEAGKTEAVNGGKNIIDEWVPGRIELFKINKANEPLEGVVFGVYDDKECKTAVTDVEGKDVVLTTDKDGHAISAPIAIGNEKSRVLYVKELSLTEELEAVYTVNAEVFEVEITPAMTVVVNGYNIINDWRAASLSLVKQDEDEKKLEGVIFSVYEDEECTKVLTDGDDKDIVLITDGNGVASASDIPVSDAGTRTLYVKETGMTAEQAAVYSLCETVFKVVLKAGENTEVNEGKPIINKFTTAPIKITKADMTTAEGVPGAKIEIYDSDGNKVYEGITGEDGKTEEIELRVGKYTFVEVVAPAGYVINKTVFEFEVNPDGTVTDDCTVTDKPTEWTITKTDLTTAEPVAGAEITIYDADGKEVYKDVTNEDGTITVFRLVKGEYTFKETVAPKGYVLNETVFKFTVDEEGNVTGDNTVTDRKIKGGIRIIKISEENGDKLGGATFGLFTADGKTKLTEGVTGEDGTVTFSDIEYGKYIIKELEAPVGFLMKKTEFEVEIAEDGKTIELTVQNSREPVVPYIPKTGDTSVPFIVLILMLVSSAAVIYLIISKATGRSICADVRKLKWWKHKGCRADRSRGYSNI